MLGAVFVLQSQNVVTQIFVWWMVLIKVKAEWSFVVKECGDLCVMMNGIETMPWWFADSWDYPHYVSIEREEEMLFQFLFLHTHRPPGIGQFWWRHWSYLT